MTLAIVAVHQVVGYSSEGGAACRAQPESMMGECEMFEFGKRYTLTFYDAQMNATEVEEDLEVVSSEIPLVKFQRDERQFIVNISSPAFVKGELQA